jgi:hypothetical protein
MEYVVEKQFSNVFKTVWYDKTRVNLRTYVTYVMYVPEWQAHYPKETREGVNT